MLCGGLLSAFVPGSVIEWQGKMCKGNLLQLHCCVQINVSETEEAMDTLETLEWRLQRHWQHWMHKTQEEDKQNKKHNTICVGHNYAQATTNNVYNI